MASNGKSKSSAGPSSNWKALSATLPSKKKALNSKQKRFRDMLADQKAVTPAMKEEQADRIWQVVLKGSEGVSEAKKAEPGRYLAIDCEMVGVGLDGKENALARVSIVNYYGTVILDEFVMPKERVTAYRTFVSGITPKLLEGAPSFEDVVKRVADIVQDRIVIGHDIQNDLSALLMTHTKHLIRDTAKYAPIHKIAGTKRPGLKKLAKQMLDIDIQSGAHSSVDDARATMAIYRTQKVAWEASLKTGKPHSRPSAPHADRHVVVGSSKDLDPSPASDDEAQDPLTITPGSILAPRDAGQQLLNFSPQPPPRKNEHRTSLNLAATLRNAEVEREAYEESVRNGSQAAANGSQKSQKKRKREEKASQGKRNPGGAGRRLDTEVIGTVRKQVGGGGSKGRREPGSSGGDWWSA